MASKVDAELPDRDETDGRGVGAGNWWELEARDAYRDWGWDAARGAVVWGHEVDVVCANPDAPGQKRIVQCKDWGTTAVTPRVLWRLVAMSYTVGAQPALATTAELTRHAEEIARHWRVRILSPIEVVGDCDSEPQPPRPQKTWRGEAVEKAENPRWGCRLVDSHADKLLREGQRYAHTSPRYSR
jgi:hypothetical protein